MLHRFVFWSLLTVSAAYAFAKGGGPERWAMAVIVLGSAITPLVLSPMARRYDAIEWGGLAVDLLVYGAFLLIAVAANRFWPLWISAMQGVGTATHLLGTLHLTKLGLTYALLVQMWVYPMLAMVVVATALHRQRRAQPGGDPSWKSSFIQSIAPMRRAGPTLS